MQTFTDANGRVWTLRLDWAAMRRSKSAGVDLSKIEEVLADFYRCGTELAEAVWACVDLRGQVANRDDFEAALTGPVMDAARDALIEAVKDFFPESRREFITAAQADVVSQFAQVLEASRTQRQNATSID